MRLSLCKGWPLVRARVRLSRRCPYRKQAPGAAMVQEALFCHAAAPEPCARAQVISVEEWLEYGEAGSGGAGGKPELVQLPGRAAYLQGLMDADAARWRALGGAAGPPPAAQGADPAGAEAGPAPERHVEGAGAAAPAGGLGSARGPGPDSGPAASAAAAPRMPAAARAIAAERGPGAGAPAHVGPGPAARARPTEERRSPQWWHGAGGQHGLSTGPLPGRRRGQGGA